MNLPAILLLIFVTLKLTGLIAWSWLWVLSPIWIAFILSVILILIVGEATFNKLTRKHK